MKNEIRLALLCMAATAAPAIAQVDSPRCGSTNFSSSLNAFTITNPSMATVNQQCFITVYPAGREPLEAKQYPGSYFPEGTYAIDLVGGGGGGGAGGLGDKGGGGGGAGAAPLKTTQYLKPGVYKLTIGAGGLGGSFFGGPSTDGNPTSLTEAYTGQVIAGFPGADTWAPRSTGASLPAGQGAPAAPGGSKGGSGGDSGPRLEEPAQAGGMLQTAGYASRPGMPGSETGRTGTTEETRRIVQSNAGGGGGASIGNGADGQSAGVGTMPGDGTRGGDGMIKLALVSAAVAEAPTGAVAQSVAPEEAKPAKKFRQ